MPIRQLPDTLINQIAAGEVIERPASVVKELVENALDAGARRIDIDLEEGGVRLIRIRDDGSGIAPEELPLAVSRHATSKIASLDDLETVMTLGFRGEALPSIASVSRFALSSRRASDAYGSTLQVDGGRVASVAPTPHAIGTTVEVRDLFFNVPARRKFLRAERTELGHIEEWLRSLALARPDIELRVAHNGKPARRYKPDAAEPAARLLEALGEGFAEQALHIDHQGAGLRLRGWIAPPAYSRSGADQQYAYVNGRAVRDRGIAYAVKRAYQELLFHGRHPAYVLFLEIEPARVDVNVHPAKHEVRFREARLVHDFVYRTLYDALAGARADIAASMLPSTLSGADAARVAPLTWTPAAAGGLRIGEAPAAYAALYASAPAGLEPAVLADGPVPPLGYAIAQLHGRYVLAENADGMIVVDMHAAHQRIRYQKLRNAYEGVGLHAQPLLTPLTLAVAAEEAELIERNAETLIALGFDVGRSGPGSLHVRSVPALLSQADPQALLQDVLNGLRGRDQSQRDGGDADGLLAAMARHEPANSGRRLTLPELNALLREVEAIERSAGRRDERPLWTHFPLADMERWFLRGR
ncbi:DNA mismatch repair endonuclease MutL [Pseudoxanthomonas wuyuanensis]|uniref:DNA mismatch repair protein MutL n=1 Tax=Pseudoxanthomonas wuyuanensis TaxID=1073196 RepID=A0A286D9A3_9GAMM|nr:DNA mismatch repair endonuclease MutL [Pseudoxanthomonas wuyuanensis]KAF1722040.1 DNA mismatch repair protein MutL [Pseudoxanthomonas wuyuanensis]SOD55220.1 DNA mismatch repair protein MutL [Pseudoxanthomonas wuyuanensis]